MVLLAALAGMQQPAIARLESGGAEPRLAALRRIAAARGKRVQVRFRPAGSGAARKAHAGPPRGKRYGSMLAAPGAANAHLATMSGSWAGSCVAIALFASSLAARAEEPETGAHFYVAADPLPYALHGFSAHVGLQLPGNRFSLEAAIFSSRLTSSLLKLIEPLDDGFTANLRGVTLEGYWHFVRWDKGALLLGVQLHLDRFEVAYQGEPLKPAFNQAYLLPTLAFRWFPFPAVGFFIKPFVSVGPAILSTAPVPVGTHSFHQLSFFPLATVILGYQF